MVEFAWSSIDLDRVPDRAPAAFGGQLRPGMLLTAYRAGFFPIPTEDPARRRLHRSLWGHHVEEGRIAGLETIGEEMFGLAWWHPKRRPVIEARSLHMGDRVRRRLRRTAWSSTLNLNFTGVVEACADREPRWLTNNLRHALTQLHRDAWYYSCEIWNEPRTELVGGLFGSAFGNMVTVDSVFHREPDAGTAAVFAIAHRARRAGRHILLDLQWPQEWHRRFGVTEVSRDEYLASLAHVDRRLTLDQSEHQVAGFLDGWA